MSDSAHDHAHRVVTYWWMLELFSSRKLPRVTPRSRRPEDQQTVRWTSGDRLPWTYLPEPRQGNEPKVWRHHVYLGVYKVKDTYATLHEIFADDPNAYDESPEGTSAAAAIVLDENGKIIVDSQVLSSALWGVGRAHDPGLADRRWAEGFSEAQELFSRVIDEFDADRRETQGLAEPPAQDAQSVMALARLAQRVAGVADVTALATGEVIIDSKQVNVDASEGDQPDFLNSFFLEDLDLVRQSVTYGNHGDALAQYLTSDEALPSDQRIDVIAQPEAVDEGVTLDRLPAGRWPSKPQHGLALSQQFAVNQALNDLAPKRGLRGVNGPPGTGKTTMLRDVLAGNVVERARRLAALERPDLAFTGTTHRWNARNNWQRRCPQLIQELTGFEMVVASANNAAVENITAEIPALGAIDDIWHAEADYFKDIATAVLVKAAKDRHKTSGSSDPLSEDELPQAWGMVAAKLGKKQNRGDFAFTGWLGNRRPTQTFTKLLELVSTASRQSDNHGAWSKARRRFRAAERAVEEQLALTRAAMMRAEQIPTLLARQDDLDRRIRQIEHFRQDAHTSLEAHIPQQQHADDELSQIKTQHERHMAAKPGALETVFSFGRAAKEWRSALAPLTTELERAERHAAGIALYIEELRGYLTKVQRDHVTLSAERVEVQSRLASAQTQCEVDRERFGDSYPDDGWIGDRRELRAPWLTADLDAARSELFLAAMQLHKDFLLSAGQQVHQGLQAAADIMMGSFPQDLEPEKIRAGWQFFFLAVPMVSTTFASLGAMFRGLGPESLGWMLIDEAGQANPQHAVGALWRAQRAVVVGDPLQLTPIVTIPDKVSRDIAANYGLSSTWIPPRASVQTLADRVSTHGTYLSQGEEDVWVSAPLKVHRRCDNPMFSVCNEIAYDGIMVHGVPPRKHSVLDETDEGSCPRVPPSRWIHAPEPTPGTHLQANQMMLVSTLLTQLEASGIPPSQVIAIAPFRAVSTALAKLASDFPGLSAGTIHTAQGREAPVVILVLSSDPERPGAKVWASQTVNLVNVAASRAQRRLYVIGDREAWSSYNYFGELSQALS